MADRKYVEVYHENSKRSSRVLVEATGEQLSVEAAAALVGESRVNELPDRQYEEVHMAGSSRGSRMLRSATGQVMNDEVWNDLSKGEWGKQHPAEGVLDDRQFEEHVGPNQEEATGRVLVKAGDAEFPDHRLVALGGNAEKGQVGAESEVVPLSEVQGDAGGVFKVHESAEAASAAAAEEAEAAGVTPSAVLKSSPEGYGTGEGAEEIGGAVSVQEVSDKYPPTEQAEEEDEEHVAESSAEVDAEEDGEQKAEEDSAEEPAKPKRGRKPKAE